jgi:bacterioferritin
MGHVERLAERILFLKGDVKTAASAPAEPITEPADMQARAAARKQQSARDYNKSALECSANADSVSKQVFEALAADEEAHFDALDKQLDNIQRFGPSDLALPSFAGGEPETV